MRRASCGKARQQKALFFNTENNEIFIDFESNFTLRTAVSALEVYYFKSAPFIALELNYRIDMLYIVEITNKQPLYIAYSLRWFEMVENTEENSKMDCIKSLNGL